jgi:hypothetical protein
MQIHFIPFVHPIVLLDINHVSSIMQILKLLNGDEEVTRWAEQEVCAPETHEGFDEEPVPTNIQSHLNLALLDLEDDAVSISSSEQTVSLEDYLQGRWSRSSSFD